MLRADEMLRKRDEVQEILQAATKHPSSKVAKLIHTVRDEPSHRNIVLLLIALAEHSEYSVDFNISLKYYLNLFDEMCGRQQLVLNEAGLLLVNSSKIYARRVDYVEAQVESQVLSLTQGNKDPSTNINESVGSEGENNSDKKKKDPASKRGRKRVFPISSKEGMEMELVPKKLCIMDAAKRFTPLKVAPKKINKNDRFSTSMPEEDYVHPYSWSRGIMYDLENDDELDCKRNYKLFTWHVEHRHHTLVPDINFQLHFKIKDFLLDDSRDNEKTRPLYHEDSVWPSIPDAYIQEYITLENLILSQEVQKGKKGRNKSAISADASNSSSLQNANMDESQQNTTIAFDNTNCLNSTSLASTQLNTTMQASSPEMNNVNASTSTANASMVHNETVGHETTDVGDSLMESLHPSEVLSSTLLSNSTTSNHRTATIADDSIADDLKNLKIMYQGQRISLSDYVKIDKHVLTARVRLKAIKMPYCPVSEPIAASPPIPVASSVQEPTMLLNILKIPVKHFNKRVLFNLGEEFKLFKQARLRKVSKKVDAGRTNDSYGLGQIFPQMRDGSMDDTMSAWSQSSICSDFMGFPEWSDVDMEDVMNRSNERSASTHADIDDSQREANEAATANIQTNLSYIDKETSTDSGIGNDSLQTTKDKSSESCCETSQTTQNNESTAELSSNRTTETTEQSLDDLEDLRIALSGGYNNVKGTSLETKIRQWHEYLRPILKKSRERHHFDVFDIGSEIIESIQEEQNIDRNSDYTDEGIESNVRKKSGLQDHDRGKTTLETIMNNKDKSYVSRYFLSTLLLVNQSNIELSVPSTDGEEPVAWSDVNMQLISTVRHKIDFSTESPTQDNDIFAAPSNISQNNAKYKSSHENNHQQLVNPGKRKLISLETDRQASGASTSSSGPSTSTACANPRESTTPNNDIIDGSPTMKRHRSADTTCYSEPLQTDPILRIQQTQVVLNAETLYHGDVGSSGLNQVTSTTLPTLSTDNMWTQSSTKENLSLDDYLTLKRLAPLVLIRRNNSRNDELDSGIFSNGDMSVIC